MKRTAHRQKSSNVVDYRIASKLFLVTQISLHIDAIKNLSKNLERLSVPDANMHYTIRDKTAGRNSLVAPIISGK